MKVLSVGPAAYFSTYDVWVGQTAGLVANGVEVHAFDYGKRLRVFSEFWKWARRHKTLGEDFKEKLYMMAGESVYVTARALDVDLVWLASPMHIHTLILRLLEKDGIRTAGYMSESPYEDEVWEARAHNFTYCFVNDRNSVERFRRRNPRSYYLAHAYDPERHFPQAVEAERDVVFVGTGFPGRRRFFEAVDWTDIQLEVFGFWKNTPPRSPLRPHLTQMILSNEEAVDLYRRSRLGIQLHRVDKWYGHKGACTDPAYSLGPRSYELAACGVFQVSDERPELHDVFHGTVPVFGTPAELEGTIRHYLAHEGERLRLAEEQRQAVQGHTFAARMREALELVA